MNKSPVVAFSSLLILTWSFCGVAAPSAGSSTNSSPIPGDTVIAKGKGFEILERDMDQVLATAQAQNPHDALPLDAPVHVINQLIEIQLVLQKVSDQEKAEAEHKVDERLNSIVKSLGETAFEQRLNATHMTKDDLRRMLFQEEAAQTSLTRQLGINITDADARKWFDDHPGAFDLPVRAHVREILLLTTSDFSTSAAPPLPEATIKAKRALIEDLHKRICSGEDFAALATQYNEDPLSKSRAGELTFKPDQMQFGDLALSMKPNQISDVLTNDEGFRFFKLIEIIPRKKVEFESVLNRLKSGLVGDQTQTLAPPYIKELRKEADVQILDPDLRARVQAADEAVARAEAVRTKAEAEFQAQQAAHATNKPSPAMP